MDANKSIGWILRIGSLTSIVLILIGTAMLFLNNGANNYTLKQIASHNSEVSTNTISAQDLFYGFFSFDGISYIVLGLMVLIATPLLRVLYSIYFFGNQKNRLYMLITVIVFFNLIFAIFIMPYIIHKV